MRGMTSIRRGRRLTGHTAIVVLPIVLGALAFGGCSPTDLIPADDAQAALVCPAATPTIGHGLSPAAVGAVYDVPAAIDSTGAREVSTELQSWLVNTVRSGTPDRPNLIRFRPGGRYWVDYTLTLRKQSGGVPGRGVARSAEVRGGQRQDRSGRARRSSSGPRSRTRRARWSTTSGSAGATRS